MRTIPYAALISAIFACDAVSAEPGNRASSVLLSVPPETAAEAGDRTYDFDEIPLGRALRILATMAHLNFIEPELDPKELVSLSLNGLSAKEAFFELARTRGFTIRERNGVVQLIRDGESARGNLVTKRYPLRNVDAHLILQSVANFLGIKLNAPNGNSPAFPIPQASDSVGLSSNGSSSSVTNSTGNMSGFSSGASRSRFTPSLPMDAPLSDGGFAKLKNAVYVERDTNALVVRATEAHHEEIARYIAEHDQPERQLVIEAQILEIDIERAKQLGLDWNFSAGNGLGNGEASLADGGLNGAYSYLSGGAILSQWEVSAKLKALESKRCSTTVSNARVVTRSGIPALVNNSVETPIEVSTVFGNDSSGNSAQTGTQTFVTGVLLDVLPRILDNGYIDLNINPTVASQVGTVKGASGQELPIISKRNATTSVIVKDGYTVGIGGLVQESHAKTRSQTPFLGRVPILGYLFQSFAQTTRRTNLVILVTPRIIKTNRFLDSQLTAEDEAVLPVSEIRKESGESNAKRLPARPNIRRQMKH